MTMKYISLYTIPIKNAKIFQWKPLWINNKGIGLTYFRSISDHLGTDFCDFGDLDCCHSSPDCRWSARGPAVRKTHRTSPGRWWSPKNLPNLRGFWIVFVSFEWNLEIMGNLFPKTRLRFFLWPEFFGCLHCKSWNSAARSKGGTELRLRPPYR